MENYKLLETVADIAYYAGQKKFYSDDSRVDISEFIRWAKEFQDFHNYTNWDEVNYMLAVEEFTKKRINEALA